MFFLYSSTMHFFSIAPLYLLCIALLPQIVFCVNPLFHVCNSNSGNYTIHSPFDNNINMLKTYLSSKAPLTGFDLKSIGEGQDVVHGLALCRGDVKTEDCKSCMVEASRKIAQLCPHKKEAIIWYDNCLLRYSNNKFFGDIDYVNRIYISSTQNVNKVESFGQKTKELISYLTTKAYISPLYFSTGELKLGKSHKLYGFVQCTKDLSGIECKKCLDDAASELGRYGKGKKAGRVVSGSCNFRYETYPFLIS